jgi:hypothetical protein
MKSRKNSTSTPGPQPATSMTELSVLQAEFDSVAKATFPDEYAEPDDRKILWAMFLAGARQTASQIARNAATPFSLAADGEFKKVTGQIPAINASPAGIEVR